MAVSVVELLDSSADDLPLPALLSRCQLVHRHLDNLIASARARPELLASAASLLQRCQHMVESQAIFSTNEDEEDISTADLPYLLVPFYRGELLCSSQASSTGQRMAQVSEATASFFQFLQRCSQYHLQGPVCTKYYSLAEQEQDGIDQATKRTAKIEKFKQDRAIAAQMEKLEQRRCLASQQDKVGLSPPDMLALSFGS